MTPGHLLADPLSDGADGAAEEEHMSLIAILVGFVVGLVQPLGRALAAAAATWAVTTLYLSFLAGPPAGEEVSDHGLTAGFWVIQVGILLVALVATWGASWLRSRRGRQA